MDIAQCLDDEPQPHSTDARGFTETSGPRKIARVACRACRQAKSRCDADSRSVPCSRCERLSQECQVDVKFKRQAKRARYDDLLQQVQRLQSAILESNRSPPISSNAAEGGVGVAGLNWLGSNGLDNEALQIQQTVRSPSTGQFLKSADRVPSIETTDALGIQDPTMPSSFLSENYSLSKLPSFDPPSQEIRSVTLARTIDTVTLTAEPIDELFQIYFSDYHPLMPFLDPTATPNDYYSRSRFLFWAIIIVASRRYDKEPSLLGSLSRPVLALAWRSIEALPHTPFVVQAIILVCTWPFPTTSMWTDASFMLITAAKSAAMQMGIHRPECIQDFSQDERSLNAEGIQDSVKLWASCYIAGQRITSAFGQESIFKPDRLIDRASQLDNIYALPPSLHDTLRMAHFSVRISALMSENTNTPFGLPAENDYDRAIQQLESGLDDLDCQIPPNATDYNRVQRHSARLQLRVFHFFEMGDEDRRRTGLLKAFQTALRLVECVVSADSKSNFPICAPTHLYRWLIVAGITILKILNSSYSSLVDYDSGKRNFNAVIKLLRRCSLQDNDNFGLHTRILSQLWHFHQSSPEIKAAPPTLRVKTRLGASVLHDALWIWRKQYQMDGSSSNSDLAQGKGPLDLTFSGISSKAPQSSEDPNLFGNDVGGPDCMVDMDLTYWLAPEVGNMPQDWQRF